jgi:predicted phage baseplate assembly protein
VTPLDTANRPGLPALSYRAGTHATFLETMKARLSSSDFPALAGLTVRDATDPAIAWLDAWATVGDVLCFYQERIANEGYLRTATERRSVLELARLVGYRPRPGVAATVYLAYTIDDKYTEEAIIPAGSRAQSVPAPGESAQSFETSEPLRARAQWNDLRPRVNQPQTEESIRLGNGTNAHVYVKGITPNLKANDPLLVDFGQGGTPEMFRVLAVVADAAADRTEIVLQEASAGGVVSEAKAAPGLIDALTKRPSVPPATSRRLARTLQGQFGGALGVGAGGLVDTLSANEASYAVSKVFAPSLAATLSSASANAEVSAASAIRVFAPRLKASLFGHNAQKRVSVSDGKVKVEGDWPIIETRFNGVEGTGTTIAHEEERVLYLDGRHESILPGSWMVVETPDTRLTDTRRLVLRAGEAVPPAVVSRAEYGLSAPATRVEIDTRWIALDGMTDSQPFGDDFEALRRTVVYAQSEELPLADEPIAAPVCGGDSDLIELDGFYEGLEAGRWVIVSGERAIGGTSGVRFSELSMLASVSQTVRTTSRVVSDTGEQVRAVAPGEKTHTFIKLATSLAYCFARTSVRIYGNVAAATHGETRTETLGSGDGTKAFQRFLLKQKPLTFVPAPNPSGIDSTLAVFVNDVRWRETDMLVGLDSRDRRFVTDVDDDDTTAVIFGNGTEGARLPTGIENVRAVYRTGIGKGGNVKAGQITLLSTRPLGAKDVINPLAASGGADRETRDQARRNAPLAVMALDRLVSVQDYQDFTRVFAGIGKARAAELSDGFRQIVHLTIAGADDIPIEPHSDLLRHLTSALRRFGDPAQPFRVDLRELLLLVLSARVRIAEDHLWEVVEGRVRTALLDAFSFDRRELGDDALLSVAVSVMQAVPGVEWVDVDTFGGIPERVLDGTVRRLLEPSEITAAVNAVVAAGEPPARVRVNLAEREGGGIRPAQLAYLSPLVPATLILNEALR